jgi:hypothetical protein
VGHVDTRIQQQFDQALTVRPAKTTTLTVQVDFEVCDFRHQPMVCDRHREAGARAQ